MFQHFGWFVTESSRHCSEYHPYFRRTPELMAEYGLSEWTPSETPAPPRKWLSDEKELPPLKMNPQLMAAARKHAENMAAQDKLDHKLDDKDPSDRTKAAGYASTFVGENIAWNQKSPKDVVKAWMESEGHRENVLHAEYTEIGVAVAKNKKGEPYWVQVFGKP